MAASINETPTNVERMDDDSSMSREEATVTGEINTQTQENEQTTTTPDVQAAGKPPTRSTVEGQREKLLYKEDLGFVRTRKDPRYVFYRQDKSKKFDVKNEDVLHCLEQLNLLEHLELLQVSRSNKSVEIRFDSEKAAQEFLCYDITIRGSTVIFRCNAFRRLRVSIHGVHPNVSDDALEYEMQNHFGGVIDIRKDTSSYKNKRYETGSRSFIITELYEHIPRSHRIFNRWCLVYYTGQPYSARKPKNQTDNQKQQPDSDKEESMSTSETEGNSQKGDSDEESSASFKTVEEKDVGFSSKRNRQEEAGEPCHKKKKEEKKGMGSDMELMISQLTTIVRELEEHEFRNIVEVLGEDRSDEIDGVIASMVCLAETARDINKVPAEHKPFYEKLRKKREKNISTEAMHDSFVHTGFYEKYLLRMQRLRDERTLQAPP